MAKWVDRRPRVCGVELLVSFCFCADVEGFHTEGSTPGKAALITLAIKHLSIPCVAGSGRKMILRLMISYSF